MKGSDLPFFGQSTCTGKTKNGRPCENAAYYSVPSPLTNSRMIRCGVHSKKGKRKELKKDPNAKRKRENELKEHAETVEKKRKTDERGEITCVKMRMMKPVPLREGFLLVFPNNRHQNRVDGFGCASLSPMQLGPVKHGQKGLPDALTIENYHQFNKCFPVEVDEKNDPLPVLYEKQKKAYQDPVPHRHKYKREEILKMGCANANTPLFSIHLDQDGKERRYSYVDSRFFYCVWYEKLATQTDDFKRLKEKFDSGYSLCICGYDAYPPTKDLYDHYCDPSRPFGHELVLYSLLVGEKPWRRYFEENKEKYSPLSFSIYLLCLFGLALFHAASKSSPMSSFSVNESVCSIFDLSRLRLLR